jgi:hypothetical protein
MPESDFERAAVLGGCLAKEYAREMLRLLVNYRSLSASEAASRLDLHVRTAQSFLEALESLGIVRKEQSHDKSRPYFRFFLESQRIELALDLTSLAEPSNPTVSLRRRVRERKDAGARFVTARGGGAISRVVVWTGEGRAREERTLNLTEAQGAFLFHLPFPGAAPQPVATVMREAGVADAAAPEILDIVERLEALEVIEGDAAPRA